MHATELNENRPSLSKSDRLTSKVYLHIYYPPAREKGRALSFVLHYSGVYFVRGGLTPTALPPLVTRIMSYGLQLHFPRPY